MDSRINDVITFWFGTSPTPTREVMNRWFVKDPAFDDDIRSKFGSLRADGVAGKLSSWRGAARGELALLVLIDQFSRNLFRDDPRAFAADPVALAIARDLLASDRARELTFIQRVVALLPFEHAEDRSAQVEGIAAFETLLADAKASGADAATVAMIASGLEYAHKHSDIVDKFGRFPHRNAALGRASTPDELAFLEMPGSRF